MDDVTAVAAANSVDPEKPIEKAYETVKPDDFISNLKAQTEGDKRQKSTTEQQPPPPPPGPTKDAEIELVSKLLVNAVDVGMQIACSAISGETDPDLFKISNTQKEQIREPLCELMKFYKLTLSPWWLLGFALVVAYSNPVMKAASIAQAKKAAKKNGTHSPVIKMQVKRGPGRPSNEELEQRAKDSLK